VLDIAQYAQEVVHGFMALHLALGQCLHSVHEPIPLRDRDTELLFDGLRIEASIVRHLDRLTGTIHGNGQGVVADDADGRRGCRGGECSVTRGGQQQIAIDLIIALQGSRLTGLSQCPELLATFQYTSRLQLVAGNVSEIAIELENFFGLNNLIALRDDRQGFLGIRAIEDFLLFEGMDATQTADAVSHEADRGFLDGPVHACGFGPDFDGLFGWKTIAEAMPGFGADIGHLLDEVCHEISFRE